MFGENGPIYIPSRNASISLTGRLAQYEERWTRERNVSGHYRL